MKTNHQTLVAIISDTHSHLSLDIEAVVVGCDMVIHAGDIGNKGILERLHASTGKVIAVRGNNDSQELWSSAKCHVVNSLPQVAELHLPGGKLVVEHGQAHGWMMPDHQKLRTAHPQAKVIVYGHTHKRVIDQSATPWVVNPGAAGNIRNNGGPSCLVLHAGHQGWEFETFQFPD